jgi:hypothetical protein
MLIGFTSLRNVFRALDALLLMILDVFFFIPKTRVALVITGGISWLDYPCSGTKSAFAPEIFFFSSAEAGWARLEQFPLGF